MISSTSRSEYEDGVGINKDASVLDVYEAEGLLEYPPHPCHRGTAPPTEAEVGTFVGGGEKWWHHQTQLRLWWHTANRATGQTHAYQMLSPKPLSPLGSQKD